MQRINILRQAYIWSGDFRYIVMYAYSQNSNISVVLLPPTQPSALIERKRGDNSKYWFGCSGTAMLK